ncbi:MAG: OmpH family outer membrane protein [Flavobacteriales bacterium]
MTGKISLALNILLAIAVIYLFTKISSIPAEEPVEAAEEIEETEKTYPSIAFVDNDSLALNYKFRLDKSKMLEKAAADAKAIENKLAKAQEDYYEIMNKSQTGGFNSDAEIKAAEAKYLRLQEDVPYLQTQMDKRLNILGKMEREVNDSLYARLYRYVDKYVSDKPVDVILLYSKGITGLYKNNVLDVSSEIIQGLNDEYEAEKSQLDQE